MVEDDPRRFLKIECQGSMRLYCDDKSVISIVHDPIQHDMANTLKLTYISLRKNWIVV